MTIDSSVESYRSYLETRPLTELERRATEAESRGQSHLAALIRAVMKTKRSDVDAVA